jgi:hypothetical protein
MIMIFLSIMLRIAVKKYFYDYQVALLLTNKSEII